MEKVISTKTLFGMLGKVYVLTQGDLTLYNETDAASEVSWIIVPRLMGEGFTPMQTINPNYIIGLVDGEGSFTAYIRNPVKIKEKMH